ncbi:MAG: hypothetical protein ACT4PL_04010, partial [Phycisphaerales bacterium]
TSYFWSSDSMKDDVARWASNPSLNFGWMIRGNETDSSTAVRFDSHESSTVANRPQLIITFEVPPPCRADFNGDGLLAPDDLDEYITEYFENPAATGVDVDGNGLVTPDDLDDFITLYFDGCP